MAFVFSFKLDTSYAGVDIWRKRYGLEQGTTTDNYTSHMSTNSFEEPTKSDLEFVIDKTAKVFFVRKWSWAAHCKRHYKQTLDSYWSSLSWKK